MKNDTCSDANLDFDVPILLMVFNRPDVTTQAFQAIRNIRPKKLFVACDGPRRGNTTDASRVAEVKKIVQNVDWECECEYLFHDNNLGCGKGPASAIDWLFSKVESGIILEDDCLPTPSFFIFCREMILKYWNNDQIMAIAGTNVTRGIDYKTDYVFSNFPIMWGWATWRRAWSKYDFRMNQWPDVRKRKSLSRGLFDRWKLHPVYIELFDKTHENIQSKKIDVWDHQWIFCHWINGGLTVTTCKNLVRNIGFDENATHTTVDNLNRGNVDTYISLPPYRGPEHIDAHKETDTYIGKNWFTATWIYYIKIVLLRVKIINLLWFRIKKFKAYEH